MKILVVRGSEEVVRDCPIIFARSDLTIQVPPPGPEVADEAGDQHEVAYVDLDPADAALIDCMRRVKEAWEEHFPEEGHLGHASSGMWFHYWFSPDLRSMSDLLAAGDSDGLRKASADFIDREFGLRGGPQITDEVLRKA